MTGIDFWGPSPFNRPAKDKKNIEEIETVQRDEGNQERRLNGMLGKFKNVRRGQILQC